jgi:hypothetical protein
MFGWGECARKYAICALELAATGVEPAGVFQMLVEGNGRGKPPAGSARLDPWPRSTDSFAPFGERASTSYE